MPESDITFFLSYVRQHSAFAIKLATDLKRDNVRVWLDQQEIFPGQRWDSAIEQALAECQSMLVVLSPAAVASHNVMDEVSYVLEEGRAVIPVLYKDCKLPFRLRRVHYADFREDYDAGLAQLSRILTISQSHPVNQSAPPVQIKSPIVGNYYESPSPNEPPFVNVGDAVHAGQVLCIIESMKLMNEIETEVSGIVTAKHQTNGTPVEYGEVLFTLQPA